MVKEKIKKTIIFFLGIFLFVLIAAKSFFFLESGAFEHYAATFAHPLLAAHNQCMQPIKQFFNNRDSLDELRIKLDQIMQERDDAIQEVIALNAQLNFARMISEVTEFRSCYDDSNAVLAQVLLKDFSEQEQFFLIEGGLDKQIKKNMVAVYKNNIVGRVVEVFPRYSKVLLITDRSCKVAAYCSQSHATGIYEGINKKNAGSVAHISHLHSVQEGELIISSGDGMIFPQGFALGKVTSATCNNLVYTIATEPLYDISAVRYCYILQKGTA